MQEHNPPTGPNQEGVEDASTAEADDEAAIRRELAKWRERVPRLAAALRQRVQENEALQREVERLRAAAVPDDRPAVVRAREARIGELESRLSEVSDHYQAALRDLKRLEQENADLRQRNERLFETMELAERQLAALTERVAALGEARAAEDDGSGDA